MALRYGGYNAAIVEAKQFSDVEPYHWTAGWIKTAVEQGMVSGYPDGTFRPDATISRAEAVAIMNQIIGLNGLASGNTFVDVPRNHWAYEVITAAATDY